VFISGGSWGVWFADGQRPSATTDQGQTSPASVFPNPFSDELHISWQAGDFGPTRIEIFNMLGERLFQRTESTTDIKLSLPALSQGNFLLRLSNGDKSFITTISKIR
jgi:hypothetical protein